MDPIHSYGEMLRISNDFREAGPTLLKFQVEPHLGRGTKIAKIVAVPYMVKTFKISSSPQLNKA